MNFIVHTSHGDYRVTTDDARIDIGGAICFYDTDESTNLPKTSVLFNSWRHVSVEGADFERIEAEFEFAGLPQAVEAAREAVSQACESPVYDCEGEPAPKVQSATLGP